MRNYRLLVRRHFGIRSRQYDSPRDQYRRRGHLSFVLLLAAAFLFAIFVLGVSFFVRIAEVVFSPLVERLIVEVRRPTAILREPTIRVQNADNADELDPR